MHIHVFSPDGEAKFWIEPSLKLAVNKGLRETELKELENQIREHEQQHSQRLERAIQPLKWPTSPPRGCCWLSVDATITCRTNTSRGFGRHPLSTCSTSNCYTAIICTGRNWMWIWNWTVWRSQKNILS